MNCLLLSDICSDLGAVLETCGAQITRKPFEEAAELDLSGYDAFVVCACGRVLDARLRAALERHLGLPLSCQWAVTNPKG